jgi:hypothetical protein
MLTELLRYYTCITDYEGQGDLDLLSHPEHADTNSRTLTVDYSSDRTNFVKIVQNNYSSPVRTSSRLSLSSGKRLRDRIAIEQHVIYESKEDGRPQRRTIKYSSDNVVSDFTAPSSTAFKEGELTIAKIPFAEGLVSIEKAVAAVTNFRTVSTYSQVVSRLAETRRGYIPRSYLLNDPSASYTPESFAWGLFLAIEQDDVALLVSQLNEFVYLAQKLNWIYFDDDNQVQINSEPIWGLPPTFTISEIDNFTGYETKEIWSNSLLGLAVTSALRHLQDRYPLNSVKLYGSVGDYQEKVIASVKALASLVSYSVSPVTGWAAYSIVEGFYTYDQPSRMASYIADLFLADYLALDQDSVVNVLALTLHKTLVASEDNLQSTSFIEFVERDFLNIPNLKDPPEVASTPELAQFYVDAGVNCYRYMWALAFAKDSIADNAFLDYQTARANFFGFCDHPVYALQHDFTVTWLYSSYYPTSPQIQWQSVLLTYMANTANPLDPLESIAFEAYAQTQMANTKTIVLGPIDPAYSAASYNARLSDALQELKRLWPFGYHWTGNQYEEDPSSVIGSILQAEAAVTTYNLIGEKVAQGNTAPATASGAVLDQWAKLLATSLTVSSNLFTRDWLVKFLTSKGDIAELLTEVFGYSTVEVTYPEPDNFSILTSLTAADLHTSYTAPVTLFEREDLDKLTYLSCAYKPSSGFSVSDADYLTSFAQPLNRDLGYQPRAVAGFPQLYPRVSFYDILTSSEVSIADGLRIDEDQVITAEEYTPGLQNVWVQDGPVVIDPFDRYVARQSVRLSARSVPFLTEAIRRTQPAGVTRTILTSYESIP